jgi:uncharacterized membrane protein YhiD involved in acid resistance
MSPEAVEILMCIGVALAAGFVVGTEREQGGHKSFGGVRTFPLIVLSGALACCSDGVGRFIQRNGTSRREYSADQSVTD